jgi:3-oxoacyl-[acyl-carrier protein] reductase
MFSDKVVLITGGGGGIGRAVARRVLDQGASVVLSGTRQSVLDAAQADLDPSGERTLTVAGAITSRESAQELVARAVERFGGVDVLVNSTGIFRPSPFEEQTEEHFEEALGSILRPTFWVSQAVVPSMRTRGGGAIVNVGSITFSLGMPKILPYVASKGGLVGFTRALAREVGPDGITVNTVAPGAFPTAAERIHPDQEGYNRMILDAQSLKRRGTPADVGNLVTFLASDAASFITGQMILIDGGWMMH